MIETIKRVHAALEKQNKKMADEVLKVVGSADMSSLTRGLTEAQRGLSQTASEALKTERSLGRLAGSGVNDVAGGLSNLGSAVNRTTESLKRFGLRVRHKLVMLY